MHGRGGKTGLDLGGSERHWRVFQGVGLGLPKALQRRLGTTDAKYSARLYAALLYEWATSHLTPLLQREQVIRLLCAAKASRQGSRQGLSSWSSSAYEACKASVWLTTYAGETTDTFCTTSDRATHNVRVLASK